MRKNKMKRYISSLVATSMGLSLLVPQASFAALPYRNIHFDLGIYGEFEDVSLPDLVYTNTATIKDTAAYTDRNNYPLDTGFNLQDPKSVSASSIEMPWWNYDWTADATGTSRSDKESRSYKARVDAWVAGDRAAAKPADPNVTWGGVAFNFPGYRLDKWTESTGTSNREVNKLPEFFPFRQTTYTAHFKSDGTLFKIKVNHEAGTGTIAPVNTVAPATDTFTTEVKKTTDETYQIRKLNIPGYKASLAESDIKIYEPGTTTPIASGKSYSDYYWAKDSDNNLNGHVFNKDMEVTYKYVQDPDVTFSVDVQHVILNADGTLKNSISDRSLLHAEENISGVGPNASLITPATAGGQARYELVTVDDATAGSLKKAPSVKRGDTADLSRRINALETVAGSNFDANYNLVGRMPNQNVSVSYVYTPNPNYRLNAEVLYVDDLGRPLTSLVLANAGSGFSGLTETADHAIVLDLAPSTSGNVPLPDLTAEGYIAPTYAVIENALDAGAITRGANSLTLSMDNTSYKVKVTYARNPAMWGNILFESQGNSTLVDRDNDAIPYDPSAQPVEAEKNAAGKLIITASVANNFPTIKPELGYNVLGYYYGNTKVVDENKAVVGGATYELDPTGSDYKLTAKVEKDGLWMDYNLVYDGGANGSMIPANKTISLYPNDAAGTPRTITWGELTDNNPAVEFIGLVPITTADPGYDIRWYDENDVELDATTDIVSYPSGTTFTARAVLSAPLTLDVPDADGEINQGSGAAQIKFNTLNPDPTVQYIVTDQAGNIITSIRGTNLNNTNHRIITNTAIVPDGVYNLYQVHPSVSLGSDISSIPSSDISGVRTVRIPVANAPTILPDANDKTKAIFEPVTPGMDYAVLRPDGTVVADWTTPSGNTLVVPNLDPNEQYVIVVKPTGDPAAATDRLPGQTFDTIAQVANNKIILVNGDDINVISPAGLDLNNVTSGTTVQLRANAINADGEIFGGATGWEVVLGNPQNVTGDGNTLYQFDMPRGTVVLRARYGSSLANWDTATKSDAMRNPDQLGPVNPDINEAGRFRVDMRRTEATPSNARAITAQSGGSETYTGMYQLLAKVQKENPVTGDWEDHNTYTGTIPTYINVGVLSRDGKEYKLYELVPGGDPVEAYTLTEDDYNSGIFRYDLKNNVEYIFGYIEYDRYTVTIKDSRNNSTIATIRIGYNEGMKSLSDYATRYTVPAVGTEIIARSGVTYTYMGLSSSETSFAEYNTGSVLTPDEVIYAYYADDSAERNRVRDDLADLINRINGMSGSDIIRNDIDNAINVLRQTSPRGATTSELQDTLNRLRVALSDLSKPNSGGGGSSGGSGSGSVGRGGASTTNNGINTYRTYSVGTDGHWRLLDPENHVWVFELSNGTRITGWANLSYTYNGVRRVEAYHFRASDGIMDYGWFKDESGRWFYMSEVHDGFFGHLIRGWHHDNEDGKWYYLSLQDGHMRTGWNQIKSVWYYLNPENNVAPTWRHNPLTDKWEYIGNTTVRPLGSMFENERTPDNYFVDENGAWVEGK